MYRDNTDEPNAERLRELINKNMPEVDHIKMLRRYYVGDHEAALKAEIPANSKRKAVINPYPAYITDTLTGYFMGTPVTYQIEDEASAEEVTAIYDANDEDTHNIDLARDASITGVAYEVLYFGEDGQIHFKLLPPEETFIVYGNTLDDKPLYAVRSFLEIGDDKREHRVTDVYNAKTMTRYRESNGKWTISEQRPHMFGGVPVVIYRNNREELGDFERVLTLIDTYDTIEANTLEDMNNFTDAYLYLRNLSGTTDDDLEKIRRTHTILVDDDGEADWLVKSVNDMWVENFKTRINADIHKFSFVPDMSDASFGGNLSGVAIRYKIMGMEQCRQTKERQFNKGLMDRLHLIQNHMRAMGRNSFDVEGSKIRFNNSLPQNLLEMAQITQALKGTVSDTTLLSLLQFVDDPLEEQERMNKEHDEKADKAFTRFSGGDMNGNEVKR